MSGNRFLVDTNIALYLLGGNKEVAEILDNTTIYISFITELELLVFKEITNLKRLESKKFWKILLLLISTMRSKRTLYQSEVIRI